jgi:hypothetical protein
VKHKEKADAQAKPLTGLRRSTSGSRRRSLISIIRAYQRFFKKSHLFWFWQSTRLYAPSNPTTQKLSCQLRQLSLHQEKFQI